MADGTSRGWALVSVPVLRKLTAMPFLIPQQPGFNGRTSFAGATSREKHPAARPCTTVQPVIVKSICQRLLPKATPELRVQYFLRAVPHRTVTHLRTLSRVQLRSTPTTHILALLAREESEPAAVPPTEGPAGVPRFPQLSASTGPGRSLSGGPPALPPLPAETSRRGPPCRGVPPQGPAPRRRSPWG